MRIRQVKPAFWKDAKLASLSEGARLFYIGLWQLADDAGFLDWDVVEVGAELYPFDSRKLRERRIEKYVAELTSLNGDRLVRYECGHAYLPHLTEHQRFGGRLVETVKNAHTRDCARKIADDRLGTVGEGTVEVEVREGKGMRASANDGSLSIEQVRAAIDDPSTPPAVRKAYERSLKKMEARV